MVCTTFLTPSNFSLKRYHVAAYFVQNVVATYERHYAALENDIVHKNEEDNADSTLGKECSNIIVLISELYNFQVISSVLVFDIIRGLLQNEITELNVELLLKVVRSAFSPLYLWTCFVRGTNCCLSYRFRTTTSPR